MKKGKLILKDGHSFDGYIFGAEKSSAGEVVFSTGMVGYPESLTDPSYQGQILTFTYPLIGNYGVPAERKNKFGVSEVFESDRIHVKGIVVSEYSENYSHWDAKRSLSDFLKKSGVPGITGIDTRALTKIIRTKGCMPGKIVVEGKNEPEFYDPNLTNLVAEVSPKKPVTYRNGKKTVVMIDCGVKNNTIKNFLARGVTIIRVPWNYDFFASGIKFDGLFISNGPGNPAMLGATIDLIKKCMDKKIPIFGICLGNQLLALAAGAKTYKLKFGNRSQNQPCVDQETGNCLMTTQNHGFSVEEKTLPKDWKVWFKNINDHTVEGIKHKKLPFMAVQYHPEACPGPLDTEYLFDQFVKKL
ncbi:MAG TPA: glutamine-hydrolyzing carbamoyl-phosphate synthase small subunit [Candidatus Gracilibacteria bacterium]|nr:glutamine-hydrolyzing carbamoyl-phosphate synthase small subunit [Candidatus Gracilibacteria bacterium]